jgi:hypothetical protein
MSTTCTRRTALCALLITSIAGTSGCVAAGSSNRHAYAAAVPAAASRSEIATTSISDRTRHRQRGPVIVIAAQLHADHPYGSGIATLRADGQRRALATARPGPRGVFSFVVTLPGEVAGQKRFLVSFDPHDSARYTRAELRVDVDLQSPLEYPFARPTEDRPATRADRLPSLWADGLPCSSGCRPAGAIAGWPLKPFHKQHALRAGLDEHRPSGFHVGLDIQAKDWAAVYAIQPGRAHIIDASWPDARLQVGSFIYWHVHPAVHEGQRVIPYVTILGHVLRSMGHLHLSEVGPDGSWRNPLRPGGRVLAPYSDDEPPVIGAPFIQADGSVVVDAFDPQSFRVTTRYITPVLAPAGLAYRLWRADGTPDGPLEWALRATHVLPDALASSVFTPQAREPGYFCFATRHVCRPTWQYRLAGGLAPRLDLAHDHGERLTIYAWDYAGNVTARDVRIR